jgi:hypothetical protein
MRARIIFGVGFILACCAFGQVARAVPETYDFEGYVGGSKVLDPAVPLPRFLALCDCPNPVTAPIFVAAPAE